MENRKNRAKQFMPFDALKGLQEALREKEIEYEEKIELSEDSIVELENKFNRIENGSYVTIKYYKNRKYINSSSIVTKIYIIRKKKKLNKKENINICDILNIYI